MSLLPPALGYNTGVKWVIENENENEHENEDENEEE